MALTKITNSAIADDIGLGGNPTTSTQTAGNSTTRIATTAFVSTAVANLVDSAPDTLNTLAELATSIGNSTTLSSTLTSSIATKLPLAGGTLTGHLNLGDNVIAKFGLDADLKIYHDGSNSYIDDAGTGHLFVRSNGDGIYFRSSTNEEIAHFNVNGSVKLYHDNAEKLVTTATGIDVTGTATMDAATVQTTGSTTAVLTLNNADGNGTLSQINLGYTADPDHGNISYTGDMIFTAGAAERMRIDSSGNVGVGTNDPDARLGIKSSGASTYPLLIKSSDNHQLFRFREESDTRGTFYINDASESSKVTLASSGNSSFMGGNVGIGTATPDSPLEISGADDTRLKLTDTGDSSELMLRSDGANTQIYTNTAHDLGIYTSGNLGQLHLKQSNGNVGIGTANPGEKLEVNGALRLGQSSSLGTAQLTHHTNNFLYIRGGSAGAIISDDSGINTLRVADGSSGYVMVETGDGTERMRIDSSGDLIKTGGVIKGERGTAAAPPYTFSDDTDTGMFNISNADLGFSVGGTERMRVLSDGSIKHFSGAGTLHLQALGGSSNLIEGNGSLKIKAAGGSVDLLNGSHESLNTTAQGITVNGPNSADLIINAPTDNASLSIKAGTSDSGAEEAVVTFYQNTSPKWQMGNITTNEFRLYNYATSSAAILVDTSGHTHIGPSDDDTRITFGNLGTANTNSSHNIRGMNNGSTIFRFNAGGGTGSYEYEINGAVKHRLTSTTAKFINKIEVGTFPQSQSNTGEAWIGRAADRQDGTLTVQLGGNEDNGTSFEIVDRAWSKVIAQISGEAPSDSLWVASNGNTQFGYHVYNSSSGISMIGPTGRTFWDINYNSYGAEILLVNNRTASGAASVLQYRTNSVVEGTLQGNSTGLTISNVSDYRKKENIRDLTGSLSVIKSLQPRVYEYRDGFGTEGDHIGFIAHEIQAHIPKAVTGDKDEIYTQTDIDEGASEVIIGEPKYQAVSYTHNELITRLVQSIQELEARITALEG